MAEEPEDGDWFVLPTTESTSAYEPSFVDPDSVTVVPEMLHVPLQVCAVQSDEAQSEIGLGQNTRLWVDRTFIDFDWNCSLDMVGDLSGKWIEVVDTEAFPEKSTLKEYTFPVSKAVMAVLSLFCAVMLKVVRTVEPSTTAL